MIMIQTSQILFLDRDNKTKPVILSFLILRTYIKKKKFNLEGITHYNRYKISVVTLSSVYIALGKKALIKIKLGKFETD